jgi:UDP-glucuronate decarboxylase
MRLKNSIELNIDLLTDFVTPDIQDKKVLITGASGLVGIHFVEFFRRRCADVISIVNSEIPNYFKDIIGEDYMTGDLTDQCFLNILPKFDYIFHCAGYSSPIKFLQQKNTTMLLGSYVTYELLNNHLEDGGKFLFLSSSEIYNSINKEPNSLIGWDEQFDIGNTLLSNPRASYIETKRIGEVFCNVANEHNIDAKSVRLCLGYGPGTKTGDQRVLHNFIDKALIDRDITMMDAGESVRTYCYITDAVKMMLNIFFSGKCNTYNVGGDSTTSILNLATIIGAYLDAPIFMNESGKLKGSPNNVKINIQKYINEFGKPNFIPLVDGLKRTIEWQKSILGD